MRRAARRTWAAMATRGKQGGRRKGGAIVGGSEEGAEVGRRRGGGGAIGGSEKGAEAGRRRGPCRWPFLRRA